MPGSFQTPNGHPIYVLGDLSFKSLLIFPVSHSGGKTFFGETVLGPLKEGVHEFWKGALGFGPVTPVPELKFLCGSQGFWDLLSPLEIGGSTGEGG